MAIIPKVTVRQRELKKQMHYHNEKILSYSIQYPHFTSVTFQSVLNEINAYYEKKARDFQYHIETELYKQAIQDYNDSVQNNYPVRAYEAILRYTITYNQNCALSLYFDQYEYTGGAHGITVRYSDSYDLLMGREYQLSNFFPYHMDFKQDIISHINHQIEYQIKAGLNQFFPEYSDLVTKNLNMDSFYLTQKGIVIYFQQYDIAPYSSGIVEFLIPYAEGSAVEPSCF